MKASEFRKLIREEVKKTLNEEESYPINISEIRAKGYSDFLIQVGNASADMIGWDHEENKNAIAKIDSIMESLLSAKRLKRKPSSEPDQPINKTEVKSGSLYYERKGQGPIYADHLFEAMEAIKKMNITYKY
jgi:hypothetical protein